jgi:hypothetical protein
MSTLVVTTITPSAGDNNAYTAANIPQATANAAGDGTALNSSINVSSLDDDDTGDFGLNFTNAFTAATYQVAATCGHSTRRHFMYDGINTTSLEFITNSDSAAGDSSLSNGIVCIGDIA